MALDILIFGEALVEVMRTGIGQPLDRPGTFTGPYPSGAPFIFAAQAARLGAKVGAVGAVGDDAFGKCLLDQLIADGIETRGMKTLSDHTTGVAFVAYNTDGSRDFVFHARHAAAGQINPDMLNESLFEGLKCLHIMGSTLSMHDEALQTGLRALELAQQHGAKISFDPNLRPQMLAVEQARTKFMPFLEAADVLFPTRSELQQLYDQDNIDSVLYAMIEENPSKIIVLTQGADGCVVVYGTLDFASGLQMRYASVGGYDVTEIDPTGAGDCFGAGFLARWLAGEDAIKAAQFANACGALAVTQQGPMAGAMTTAEVLEFMKQNQPKDTSYYAG